MSRFLIAYLALAGACLGKEFEPSQVEIALHRREVYQLARDYIFETFNLEAIEEGSFNPVRFDSYGVWGSFDVRLKELGDDRFEVQGWLNAVGHRKARVGWAVHLRYKMEDPLGWRYRRVDEVHSNEPEFLGWKFGDYYSLGYSAEYDPTYIAAHFGEE